MISALMFTFINTSLMSLVLFLYALRQDQQRDNLAAPGSSKLYS